MDKFISVVLSGSVISMIFAEGKFSKVLKMLLSAAVIFALFSLPSDTVLLPEFSAYESETTDGTARIISRLAKAEAEKILSKTPAETEISVVSVGNSYYVEKITVLCDNSPSEAELSRLREYFGLPPLGVEVIKREGTE